MSTYFICYLSPSFRSHPHEKVHDFIHTSNYINFPQQKSELYHHVLLSVLRWSHPLLSLFFLCNSFSSVIIICSRMNCRNPMMISHTFNHYRSPKLRFWRYQLLTIREIIIPFDLLSLTPNVVKWEILSSQPFLISQSSPPVYHVSNITSDIMPTKKIFFADSRYDTNTFA